MLCAGTKIEPKVSLWQMTRSIQTELLSHWSHWHHLLLSRESMVHLMLNISQCSFNVFILSKCLKTVCSLSKFLGTVALLRLGKKIYFLFSFSISCFEFSDCWGRDGSEWWPLQSEWSLWICPEAQFYERSWEKIWPWNAPKTEWLPTCHPQHTGTRGK